MDKPLTTSDLITLAMLLNAVQAGQPITYLSDGGTTHWGIARTFTHEGGGFLNASDDVRDAFVWLSGGTHYGEAWIPVWKLVEGIREGRVALDYRP